MRGRHKGLHFQLALVPFHNFLVRAVRWDSSPESTAYAHRSGNLHFCPINVFGSLVSPVMVLLPGGTRWALHRSILFAQVFVPSTSHVFAVDGIKCLVVYESPKDSAFGVIEEYLYVNVIFEGCFELGMVFAWSSGETVSNPATATGVTPRGVCSRASGQGMHSGHSHCKGVFQQRLCGKLRAGGC